MPLIPVADLARGGLHPIGAVHFQRLVNEVGPITEAEVEAHIAEAARIHAAEWNRTPHPRDTTVPDAAHNWAIRHIAANLAARARGYAPDRASYRFVPVRRAPEMELQPAARTTDFGDAYEGDG